MRGVGSAVIGVRMMSQSSKKAPNAREVGVEHRLHPRPLAVGRGQAGFPDLDVDRFDLVLRWPLQPERSDQVGDGLREIADIAGRLGGESGAEIHVGQRPIHLVPQPLEEATDPLQFRGDRGRGAVVAPFVGQSDTQPARIALDEVAIGFSRCPERHELAGRAAAATVYEGGRVANGAGVAALDRHQARQIRQVRRDREHARATLLGRYCRSPPAGMRIDPPPSVACEIGSTPAATIAPVPAEEPHVV